MTKLERNYRRARNVLSRPNPKHTAAMEAHRQRDREARAEVRKMLDAGGDARALYEAETDTPRRVALLGYLRRGDAALQ